MLNYNIKKWITYTVKGKVKFNHNLAKYTSFKIGGPADAIIEITDHNEIIQLVKGITKFQLPLTIIGNGSNILIKDKGIRGIVLINSNWKFNHNSIKQNGKHKIIEVPSSINMQAICAFAINNGLSGMNFALGIPGTIGGAISTNAKTKNGSILDILLDITTISINGKIERFTNLSMNTFIKNDTNKNKLILKCKIRLTHDNYKNIKNEAKFLMIKRKISQPSRALSAGCFFKNPNFGPTAGELIDKVGLKGLRIGDAMVSTKHANFIINLNKASAADILKLANQIRETIYKHFAINLKPEVHILGT